MKYTLILGGCGFIGANLVHEYIRHDKNVIILDLINEEKIGKLSDIIDSLTIINGSLNDENILKDIFSNYEIEEVVHLISSLIPSSTLDDFKLEQSNVVIPTINLIKIMIENNVRKFIYLSSGGTVYGNYKGNGFYEEEDLLKPINYYGLSKCNLEEIIEFEGRKGNIDYLILRPSNPFGKYQNILGKQGLIAVILGKMINGQEIEVWGDGHSVRDYIPVENLTQYIMQLSNLKVMNETYNIGSGVGFYINKIIEMIEENLNVKLKKIYKDARNVDTDKLVLNIDKLKNAIEVEEIDFNNSISNFYNYLLEDKDAKR